MEWKPIETAPKDGTSVLLFIEGNIIEGSSSTWCSGEWDVVTCSSHGCGCCSYRNEDPTHWMPIPEPPK